MPLPVVTMIAVPMIGAIGIAIATCLRVRDKGKIAVIDTQNKKEIDLAKICEKGIIDIETEKRETIKTRYEAIIILTAIIAISSLLITLFVNTSTYALTLLTLLIVRGLFYLRRY